MHVSTPLVLATLMLLAACGDGSSQPADAGSPVDGSVDPLRPLGGDVRSICDAYIDCIGYAWGGDRSVARAAYGPEGTCFRGFSAAECREQCLGAIAGLHQTYDQPACNVCDSNAHCTDKTPYCNTATHRCFECKENIDCKDPDRPTCDAASGRCGNCLSRADCAGTYLPACDPATSMCSQCDTHADCEMYWAPRWPSCNIALHYCTLCVTNEDCERISDGKKHYCDVDPTYNSVLCLQCRDNADCPPETPVCSDLHTCK